MMCMCGRVGLGSAETMCSCLLEEMESRLCLVHIEAAAFCREKSLIGTCFERGVTGLTCLRRARRIEFSEIAPHTVQVRILLASCLICLPVLHKAKRGPRFG